MGKKNQLENTGVPLVAKDFVAVHIFFAIVEHTLGNGHSSAISVGRISFRRNT